MGKHDDRFHVHKTLGFTMLSHFAYRLYNKISHGTSGLGTSLYCTPLLLLHGCLSVSSLIFVIPRNRVVGKPMIWPEFRAHSICFALRSVFVCLSIKYFPGNVLPRVAAVFATLILADLASRGQEKTTMRDMPLPSGIPPMIVNTFYSVSQVLATMNMLSGDMDDAFFVLLPIQLAAFLMTLVRKGYIGTEAWHAVYTLALFSNFATAYYKHEHNRGNLVNYWAINALFCEFRFNMRINKYLLWTLVVLRFLIIDSTLVTAILGSLAVGRIIMYTSL